MWGRVHNPHRGSTHSQKVPNPPRTYQVGLKALHVGQNVPNTYRLTMPPHVTSNAQMRLNHSTQSCVTVNHNWVREAVALLQPAGASNRRLDPVCTRISISESLWDSLIVDYEKQTMFQGQVAGSESLCLLSFLSGSVRRRASKSVEGQHSVADALAFRRETSSIDVSKYRSCKVI